MVSTRNLLTESIRIDPVATVVWVALHGTNNTIVTLVLPFTFHTSTG